LRVVGSASQPPPRGAVIRDNAGYLHRDPVDEPSPPPYSSLSSGNSPPAPEQSFHRPVLSRDRRTGRSLPPTPTRPPPPPSASCLHDSASEHIYDEPSTLFRDSGVYPPLDTGRPSATLGYPRSSVSRIRLGTTALRPGTLRCPSPRQRPPVARFGTHRPRRSAHVDQQISDPGDVVTSRQQPFFISNFGADRGNDVMADQCGRMLAYETATPTVLLPQPVPGLRGGVYDQPWDSRGAIDRVAAIPLTAMPRPPSRPCATLNSSRRGASPQFGWRGTSSLANHEHHHPSWTDDAVPEPWPQRQYRYSENSPPPLYPAGSSQAGEGSMEPSRARNQCHHLRAESYDSCGDSASSPLVHEAPRNLSPRRRRDNSEILNLLSPTCV